jgi:MFS family permease
MVAGMFGMFFLGALYLQRVLGYGAVEVGLAFLPVALGIGILSLGASARLILRFGARSTLLPGLVLVAAGLAVFQRAPLDAVYVVDLLPAMLLLGVGAGLAFPALMTLAMSGATPEDSGLASGLVNTTQQVGGALGLAVLATLSTARTEDLTGAGEATAQALTSGYRLAFAIAALLVTAAVVLAATVLRGDDEVAVEPVAEVHPARADERLAFDEAA